MEEELLSGTFFLYETKAAVVDSRNFASYLVLPHP